MTPDQLIELAKRKNKAHTVYLKARGALRGHGGSEKDRDIAMDHATVTQREAYENLLDEYNVRLLEYQLTYYR